MQADREEWVRQQELNQKKENKHNGATSTRITNMLQQASVKQEYLTNDENWNYYLTLIQSWIDKTRLNAQSFRDALESPDLVSQDERKKFLNYLMICNERIGVLEAVIALPKQIIEDHEKAKLAIDDIPDPKYNS